MNNRFNQLVLNKIFKNLDLDSIKSCGLVNKQFNKAFNVDILWNSLFTIHYNESIDQYKKVFIADSYKDTYKKYISLKYLKKSLNLNHTIIELALLKILNLDFNDLTSIPAEIGNLALLQELSLYNNKLTSIPAEIGNLASLQVLYLNGNNLTSISAEIGNLASLQTLYLSNNKLTLIPVEIGNLVSLKYLYLDNNSLISIPAEIENLALLQKLDLSNNNLTSIPTKIGNLSISAVIDVKLLLFKSNIYNDAKFPISDGIDVIVQI